MNPTKRYRVTVEIDVDLYDEDYPDGATHEDVVGEINDGLGVANNETGLLARVFRQVMPSGEGHE